jgi:hypothetical protein
MRGGCGRSAVIGVIGAAAVAVLASCSALSCGTSPWSDLLVPGEMYLWQTVYGDPSAPPWALADGVYQGAGSWVAYDQQFGDFVMECEFLFDGTAQGGIVIRCDPRAGRPWRNGYELDIDAAGGRGQGHVHFPVNPQPYAGDAVFTVGEWHSVRVEARGPTVTVWLDGTEAIQFTDDAFARGHICLEGTPPAGVKYRGLRVRPIAR